MQETSSEENSIIGRHPGPTKHGESEEERLANLPRCLDCGMPRIWLHLEPHRRMKIRQCINKKCFHFIDITKLITWKQ